MATDAIRDFEQAAVQCESAGGPDRTLDARIASLLGYSTTHEQLGEKKWYRRYYGDGPLGIVSRTLKKKLPEFTGSLDAAVSLVPTGWFLILDDLGGDGLPLAVLHTPEGMRKVVGVARDLKLALCAASLRAFSA